MQKRSLLKATKVKGRITNFSSKLFLGAVVTLSIFLFFTVALDSKAIKLPSLFSQVEEVSLNSGTVLIDYDSGLPIASIADVEIDNVKIISQKVNRLKISFRIINHGSQVQPNIKYGVTLIQGDRVSEMPINEKGQKVYAEEINLKGGREINRIVEYVAPSYLKGAYSLWVTAKLPSGVPLGKNRAKGFVSLKGDNQFIEIVPQSCRLMIEGAEVEKEHNMHNIAEGIVVNSQKEKLIGLCKVINHFDEVIEFAPVFEIYSRSSFGERLKYNQTDSDNFQFNPGEEKDIALILPTSMDSQAYDVKVTLKTQEKIVSNPVLMHYILKGSNATIQNITFDKLSYLKGETARINLFWTGPANQFLDSRMTETEVENLTVDLSAINKKDGQVCGQAIKEIDVSPENPPIALMTLPIILNCEEPVITATIKNQAGKVLFQQVSNISENNGDKLFGNRKNIVMLILISLFTITAILTYDDINLFIKHRRQKKINSL